jgi:hypothetical protein
VNGLERALLAEFAITLFKRSPSTRSRHATSEFAKAKIENSLNFLVESGVKLSPELIALTNQSDWLEKARKQAEVRATLMHSSELIHAISQKGLIFAVPANDKKSFILGSIPFLRLKGITSEGIADPTSELWLPFSPHTALVWFGKDDKNSLLSINDAQLRYVNKHMWQQSSGAISASDQLLVSIANSK